MASDMSGYQGEEGKRRWLQESGGTEADYNREMSGWQQSTAPAAAPAAAPAPAAGGFDISKYGPNPNLGEVAATDVGLQAWGGEIDEQNRQTAAMTPEQRARWAQEHIADMGSTPWNELSWQDKQRQEAKGYGQAEYEKRRQEMGGRQGAYNYWLDQEKYYDASCPPNTPYRSSRPEGGSQCVEKPDDCPPGMTLHGSKCVSFESLPEWAGGSGGGGGGGGGRGGPGGGPRTPPPPTTFGSQLSYTGNPLTDMLLYQFNTGSQLSDPSKMNAFAMGEDRQEGGEGANADAGKRTGQLLQGGGLWWQGGQDKGEDAFGGFRADTANSNAANALSMPNDPNKIGENNGAAPTPAQIAAPPPAPSSPAEGVATGAPPPSPQGIAEGATSGFNQPMPSTPVANMLQSSFRPRNRKRDENGMYDPFGGYQGQEREAQVF